jgi:hypothetical protein
MAKSFREIYQSKQYMDAPLDEKIGVREDYFNKIIMPKVMSGGDDPDEVRNDFYKTFNVEQKSAISKLKGAAGDALGTLRSKLDNVINDIDRDTDVNDISFRGKLSKMSGSKEQSNFLNMTLGKENWGVGNRGDDDYAITTKKGMEVLGMGNKWKGKPVAIDADNLTRSDFFGDTQSGVLPVAGAIAGGAMTGGLGFIPAMAAAGAGGALGTGVREWMQPKKYQLQTGGEIGKDMLTEGALAMGGEGIGRMLRPLGRAIMGPNRRRPFTAFGKQPEATPVVEPERSRLALKALDKDVVLPVTQATGRQKILGFAQRMGDTIVGNPRAEGNAQAVAREGAKMLAKAGGRPFTDEGAKVGSRPMLSNQGFGQKIQGKVAGEIGRFDKSISGAKKGFVKTLENAKNKLRGKAKYTEKTDTDIRNSVVGAHRDFMEDAGGRYTGISKTLSENGVGQVISTRGLKLIARKLMKDIPDAKVKIDGIEMPLGRKINLEQEGQASLKTILEELGDHISIEEAMWLRKVFGRHAYSKELKGEVPNYMAGQLKKAIDRSFDRLATKLMDPKTGRFLPEEIRGVVAKDIKGVNKFYNEGSTKFDDYLVKRIGKDLGEGSAVQPSEIVSTLEGMPFERVSNFMGIIREKSPKLIPRIQAKYFDDVLWKGAQVGEDLISPKLLLNNISKMKSGTLNSIYGETKANEIRSLSKDLFRYADDNIGIDALGEGKVADSMRKVIESEAKKQEYISRNFVGIASKGKNVGGSDYAKLVEMSMKDSGKAKELLEIVGEGSPVHKEMREMVLQKMLNTLEDNITDPIQTLMNGEGLARAMKDYMGANVKHGDNPLRVLLGKELFGDLKDLAKISSMTVTKGNSGLVAMSIALNPFSNLGRLAEINILSKLLNRPGFVRWMVKGHKAKGFREASDSFIRTTAQTIAGFAQSEIEDVDFEDEIKRMEQ